MSGTTIFSARKIITMNSYRAQATHVAVRDGRILGTGALEDLTGWGDYTLDDRFANKVLMPGFVEGHCHVMEGAVWDFPYIGFQDRYDPQGKLWKGVISYESLIAVLSAVAQQMDDADTPLFAWGFDPIYFGAERMTTEHIDKVSTTRPVLILHSNGHLLNVNSVVLNKAGISRETDVYGIIKDANGNPTGELMEMAAQYMAYRIAGNPFMGTITQHALKQFSKSATNAGVTTATDLFATFDDKSLNSYKTACAEDDFAVRLRPAMQTLDLPFDEGVKRVQNAMTFNTDKLIFGLCKVMTDGSIQGFTARLKWPGYYKSQHGSDNGLWNLPPERLTALVEHYHAAGMHLHIHTNGDEASELMVDAIEAALNKHPRADHRHTLQHCQMADEALFKRMAALGICANLFANHIFYWGDQHYAITMGPDRAMRSNACATAMKAGVPIGIHSDAPVTPLAPLFTAWCAVNRLTTAGMVLGENEKLDVMTALRTITLGAAYTIKMDHLVGSIEPGKFADFAVLDDDPTTIAPDKLKDIGVWGTIVAGRAHAGANRTDLTL